MDATLQVLDAMGLGLSYEFVEAGLAAHASSGELLPAATMEAIRRLRVALKSPLTTPVGEGFSSINVELRKRFDLYANVRPAQSFPNTKSRFPSGVDLITVRENTEGAYGSEGQTLSPDGEQAQSLIRTTRRGCERIVRYAFDLARKSGRRKVTLVHKANIMKTTSGLFLKVGREVAEQYPEIECNEMIVDNTCMQLVMRPEQFDIICTTNLFGDIISDLCAGLVATAAVSFFAYSISRNSFGPCALECGPSTPVIRNCACGNFSPSIAMNGIVPPSPIHIAGLRKCFSDA
jgi:isocitrate dehydrogenase (NAD+)